MLEYNPDTELWWLIGMLAAFILGSLLVGLCVFLHDFSRELKYINSEIERTTGSEQRYWRRKRRRLWLSLFLFSKYR